MIVLIGLRETTKDVIFGAVHDDLPFSARLNDPLASNWLLWVIRISVLSVR